MANYTGAADQIAITTPLDTIIKPKRTQWEKLRSSSILITGASGFFGSWILHALLQANELYRLDARAVVVTRSAERFRSRRGPLASSSSIDVIEGDIRDFETDLHFDYMIHAAADSTPQISRITDEVESSVIIDGTKHALEIARRNGVARALFVSSGAVYGRQPDDLMLVDEEYADGVNPRQRTNYGNAKWDAESLCRDSIKTDFAVTIARCFAFVGPYLPLDAHFAIGNFIRDSIHGGPIVVSGDGTSFRSYLYMSDLSWWLWSILLNGRSGNAYNVGSEEALTIADIASIVAGLNDPSLDVVVKQQPTPNSPPSRYIPSTALAQRELGLVQTVPLIEGIKLTKAWYDSKNSGFIEETS